MPTQSRGARGPERTGTRALAAVGDRPGLYPERGVRSRGLSRPSRSRVRRGRSRWRGRPPGLLEREAQSGEEELALQIRLRRRVEKYAEATRRRHLQTPGGAGGSSLRGRNSRECGRDAPRHLEMGHRRVLRINFGEVPPVANPQGVVAVPIEAAKNAEPR